MTTSTVAGVLAAQGVLMAALLTVALDQQAHKRIEQVAGVNTWGYRGRVAPAKASNEIRVGVLGGSLAFGWGVAASETFAPALRQLVALALDRPGGAEVRVVAVNLGGIGLPPAAYTERFARYDHLGLDVLCVYPDPRGTANGQGFPDPFSGVTRLTGYVPALPLVLEEKGGLAAVVGRSLESIDHALYAAIDGAPAPSADAPTNLLDAVQSLRAHVPHVVLVLPAPSLARRITGYEGTPEAAFARFGAAVPVVELGRDPRLHLPDVRLDGLNASTAGHALAAALTAPVVIELLEGRRDTR